MKTIAKPVERLVSRSDVKQATVDLIRSHETEKRVAGSNLVLRKASHGTSDPKPRTDPKPR